MISVLLKRILLECGLKQKELAELLGVPIQRIKRLSGGEASKFTREEGESLIKKLNIRAEWLVTGEGDMFQSANEKEFSDRLDALNRASKEAAAATSDAEERRLLQESLFKRYMEDIEVKKLPTRNTELLAGFNQLDESGKIAVESMINALLTKK